MNSLTKILSSRTVWVFIVAALFNGLQAIVPMVNPSAQGVVDGILAVLGIYYRANPQASFANKED